MTVQELIAKLKTFPQNALVVSEGYEEGFDSVKTVSSITITENTRKEWYVGQYVESNGTAGVDAVLLFAATKTRQ